LEALAGGFAAVVVSPGGPAAPAPVEVIEVVAEGGARVRINAQVLRANGGYP